MGPRAMVGAVFIAMTAACGTELVFACSDDTACSNGAEQGVCAMGFCAFDDPTCDSGHRYGDLAPPRQAGRCVPPEGEEEPPQESKGGESDASDSGTSVHVPEVESSDESDGSSSTTADLPVIPAGVCTEVFADEFDLSIDPAWGFVSTSDEGVSPEWATGDGSMEFWIPAMEAAEVWIQRDLHAVEQPGVVTRGFEFPMSGAYGFVEIWAVHDDDSERRRIELDGSSATIVEDGVSVAEFPFDAAAWAWLRVSVRDDASVYEASPDGDGWTELYLGAPTQPGSPFVLQIGMRVFDPSASPPTVTIDHAAACSWAAWPD